MTKLNIFTKQLQNYCDEYAQCQLEAPSDSNITIQDLRKQGLDFFIEEYFELNDLDCPMKIAKRFFKEINKETIQEAWANVNLTEYSKSCDLLGTEEETLYLISKCKCICSAQGNSDKLSLLIVANIINTLGLDKKIFVDFLNFTSLDLDTRLKTQEIDNLWELSKKQPKCTACNICCGKDMAVEDVD